MPARRGRGRPKKGPRVVPDSRTGEFIIRGLEIRGAESPIPTGTWDREEAELRLARERLRVSDPGLVPAERSVPLRTVIGHGAAGARTGALKHLVAFWGDVPLDCITRASCWAYEDFRREQAGGRGGRDGPATGTIRNELANLATMVRAYCADEGIDPAPKVYLPAEERAERRFLRVRDVNRLLLAAEGCVWDAGAGDWRRDGGRDARPARDGFVRTRLRPMVRLLPILAWTGSRPGAVVRATWSRRGDRGWMDLRIGIFFRKGADERVTTKRRPPVRLVDHLRRMLEGWAAEDAEAGLDAVVHDDDGRAVGFARACILFSEVRARAGFDETVTLRTLRSSCAIWLMEAGLSVEEAAAFLGNTAGVLSGFYDHYAPEFSHAAADALDSRAF